MYLRAWSRRLRRAARNWLQQQGSRSDDYVRLGLARLEDRIVLDGAGLVVDLQPGTGSANPTHLTEFGGSYYFTADGTNAAGQSVGRELFRLDADGSVTLAADLNPGATGSDPGEFTLYNLQGSPRLLFAATGPQGRELYQLDTSGNVSLVYDVNPGPAGSDPKLLSEYSGKLYFTAQTPAAGRELYVMNNGGNVSLIADLHPGPASSDPGELFEFSGSLYFSAEVGGTRHLFRQASSGTSDPVQVTLGSGVSDPRDIVVFDDKLYFSAHSSGHGRTLFELSVARNGNESVREIDILGAKSPESLFAFGQHLYFSATDPSGRELYRLNALGTVSKLDLATGSASSSPAGFVGLQGDLYFAATVDGSRGLWRVAGSASVLEAVSVPLPAGVALPQEAVFYALGNELYFAADGPAGRELYVMNAARVVSRAADVNPGPASSDPAEVVRFGGQVHFAATQAGAGRELFVLRSDPASSSLRVVGERLVFNDDDGDEDNRLVISSTGTHLVIVDENGHTISLLTAIVGANGAGTNAVMIPLASLGNISTLEINTRGGDDSVTLDLSSHADSLLAQFATAIYDGGTNTEVGDKLRLIGDGATRSVYTPSAATTGSGVIVVSSLAEALTFRFAALEPVDFTGMAEARLVAPTTLRGADILTVAAGFDSLDGILPALIVSGTVGGTTIESGYFFGNQTVVLDTGNGLGLTDSVTIASAANAHGNANLIVGTGPLGADVVAVTGSVALSGNLQIASSAINVQGTVDLGGAALFEARGNIAFGSAAQLFASQTALTAGGSISLADGSLVEAGGGAIRLLALGNISLGRILTTSGAADAISVTSLLGSIFSSGTSRGENLEAESLGAVVTLAAAQGMGTAANPLQLAVRNLNTLSGGNQFLSERDNLAGLNLNSGAGNIRLAAGGQIQDSDGGVDIVAGGLVLSAAQAGSLAQPLQTRIGTLSAIATGGGLHLVESDGLTVVSAVAAAGNVHLRNLAGNLVVQSVQAQGLATMVAGAGSILAGAGGIHVAAGDLELAAAGGVGTPSQSLAILAERLEASGGPAGVYLTTPGSVQIGGIGSSLLGLAGLASTGGNIRLASGGSIQIVEQIVTSAGGGVDVRAVGDVTLAALVSTASGDLTLAATRHVVALENKLLGLAGGLATASGTIRLLADSDRSAGGTIHFAGDIEVGTGQVIFDLTDPDGELSGSVHGQGGLVKQGAGTLTLTAASFNTYLGSTSLLAGALRVDGVIGGQGSAGTFSLAEETLLTGAGLVNAPIDSPSASARIESLGNLTLGDGSNQGFRFAGILLVAGGDILTIRDGNLAELGVFTQIAAGGRLTAAGGVEVGSGELLAGSGAVSGNIVVLVGGSVSPGVGLDVPSSLGVLSTARGDLVLAAGSTLLVEIHGPQPGTQFDQLRVQGTVDVSGAILQLSGGGFNPPRGTVFTLVVNDDAGGAADRVVGQFAGLAEGATVRFGDLEATISYVGGTGNDITLTIPNISLIRTIAPESNGSVAVDGGNDTGGGGAVSYTLRSEPPAVIFEESNRPVATSQAADVRPQALETRAVERLRVFLKVVDEVTGDEEGNPVDLDPRVIDDVLDFFRRIRFPNGAYRIYLQEAGRAPRLIIEVAIRDGQVVSPENTPAREPSIPSPDRPGDAVLPTEVPERSSGMWSPGESFDLPAAGILTSSAEGSRSLAENPTTGAVPPMACPEPVDNLPARVHRWSHAAPEIAASFALAAAVPAADELRRDPSLAQFPLPRTRFYRRRFSTS